MGDEIELISDGDGLAVIGSSTAVERFLASEKLPSKELVLSKIGTASTAGSTLAAAGSTIAAESGRWVKLTRDSAQSVKKFGLMDTKTPGVKQAMIGKPGKIQEWIQISKGPGSVASMASNPAVLAGAAGVMSQLAMQQAMAEITDYLARIDEKLDDVLRAQTNQVLARMDGVDLAIREATTVRDTVGRVSDVTWSKIQNSSATILETQAFALRQLADLTEKIEERSRVDELAKIAKQAEVDINKWLTVLARCFQLHDAVAVIELDRVLDADPEELDRHRLGLKAARHDRLELISNKTELLLERMAVAASTANSKVLLNPIQSPAVVKATNQVATEVHEFRELLEIESRHQSSDGRGWGEAAGEQWGKVRDAGAGSLDSVKNVSGGTREHVRSATGKVSEKAQGAGSGGIDAAKNLGKGALGRTRSIGGKLSRVRGERKAGSNEEPEEHNDED